MSIERIKASVHERLHPEKVAFWFVRHGESLENTKGAGARVMHDTPLTNDGIREIRASAKFLKQKGANFTHIFSGSKLRTRQTAEIIGSELGLPVIIKAGLDERDWGEHADRPWEEISKMLGSMGIEERFTYKPNSGESWQEMEERLLSALEDIERTTRNGEDILIVTHRGDLRAIMPVLANAGKEKHEDFSVPLGSISKFSFDKDEFDFIGLKPTATDT